MKCQRQTSARAPLRSTIRHHMRSATIAVLALTTASLACAESSDAKFKTLLGFELNKSTFVDIKVRLGFAQELEVPEGHHESAICYITAAPSAVVIFSTDGEFGGPERLLLGITVRAPDRRKDGACLPITARRKETSMDGISIGMTEQQFRALIGEPTQPVRDGRIKHVYESKRPFTAEEDARIAQSEQRYFDVSHSVWGVIENGRLVEYGTWYNETM